MAEGGEEIPMRPIDPEGREPDEEGNTHHEEETSFGGHENHGFDPDDYQNEDQRAKARSTINWLEENGIDVQSGVKFSEADGHRLVSKDGIEWFEVGIGATSTGERFALIPFRGANRAPFDLLLKFGLHDKGFHEHEEEVKTFFPEYKSSKLVVEGRQRTGPFRRGWLRLSRKGASKYIPLSEDEFEKIGKTKDGETTRSKVPFSKLPEAIKKALGRPRTVVLDENRRQQSELRSRIDALNSEIAAEQSPQAREDLESERESLEENENQLEEEETQIVERMSLKDRVKDIFKKHGVKVVGVLAAVGTVIGVIVSNLRAGLTKVAKGVGNGLKDLGKKLAGILPGMVGAIVSFLFKTAGEAVGFLAKHAWLLILLVVTFVIEQYKK